MLRLIPESTPARKGELVGIASEKPVGDGLGSPEAALHSVWGRVVLDIPAFCCELVAALAE